MEKSEYNFLAMENGKTLELWCEGVARTYGQLALRGDVEEARRQAQLWALALTTLLPDKSIFYAALFWLEVWAEEEVDGQPTGPGGVFLEELHNLLDKACVNLLEV